MDYLAGVRAFTVKGISDIGVMAVLHYLHFSIFLFARHLTAKNVWKREFAALQRTELHKNGALVWYL